MRMSCDRVHFLIMPLHLRLDVNTSPRVFYRIVYWIGGALFGLWWLFYDSVLSPSSLVLLLGIRCVRLIDHRHLIIPRHRTHNVQVSNHRHRYSTAVLSGVIWLIYMDLYTTRLVVIYRIQFNCGLGPRILNIFMRRN